MTSPKHLWSGDWERESDDSTRELPPVLTREPEPAPEPEPKTPGGLRLTGRTAALTALALLVLAGAVFATVRLASGGSAAHTTTISRAPLTTPTYPGATAPNPFPTTPLPGISTNPGSTTNPSTTNPGPSTTSPSTTNPTTTTSGSQGDALGLVLVSVPGRKSERVSVQAVVPGSAADSVGIGPGAVLLTVNGQQVSSPGQVESILAKLPKGTTVTLQVLQGTEQITAQITEPNIP